MTWEGRESKWRKQQKVAQKGGCAVKKVMPLSQIFLCNFFSNSQSLFLLGFSWRHNITASNKKSTSKKEPTSASIWRLHKNIIIPLICQCQFFIYTTCVSTSWVVYHDVIFYLLCNNVIYWSSHICKKSSFLSFYSFLVKSQITEGKC